MINTNNGAIDKLSLLSVNDIEDYWMAVYSESLKGTFRPVGKLVSYDSNDPSSPIVCHIDTYQLVNAFFSSRCNLIAWDRGSSWRSRKNTSATCPSMVCWHTNSGMLCK